MRRRRAAPENLALREGERWKPPIFTPLTSRRARVMSVVGGSSTCKPDRCGYTSRRCSRERPARWSTLAAEHSPTGVCYPRARGI